jgi:hypothetical protein
VLFPISIVPEESLYVTLYGTGIRRLQSQDSVQATVGGLAIGATAGPSEFQGVDQVNIGPLPVALKQNPGEIDIVVTVDGKKANIVRMGVF